MNAAYLLDTTVSAIEEIQTEQKDAFFNDLFEWLSKLPNFSHGNRDKRVVLSIILHRLERDGYIYHEVHKPGDMLAFCYRPLLRQATKA